MNSYLLSGLIGALIATGFSILYHYFAEQVRRRAQLMLEVVSWADDIFDNLQVMLVAKERVYAIKDHLLTDEEYRKLTRELKIKLLSSATHAKVALIYGEDEEMRIMNALRGELEKIFESLLDTKEATWRATATEIASLIENEITPLRKRIERRFLSGARIRSVALDAIANGKRGLVNMLGKNKKIIAREGLVLLGILTTGVFFGNRAHIFFWTVIAPQLSDGIVIYPERTLRGAIVASVVSLYTIYLLFWAIFFIFRFILWAIKTLKEK